MHFFVPIQQLLEGFMEFYCVSMPMTFVTASFISLIVS